MPQAALALSVDADLPDVRALVRASADPIAWAIAGTVWSGLTHGMAPHALVRGLPAHENEALAARYFAPLRAADLSAHCGSREPDAYDEFDELLALLKAHACDDSVPVRWLAHALATACMYENHLWQDLHLPARAVLSELFSTCFPTLAARNTGNMKWKKFLYKQLCEAAETPLCKAPTCSVCSDYALCFGSEESVLVADAKPSVPMRILVRSFR